MKLLKIESALDKHYYYINLDKILHIAKSRMNDSNTVITLDNYDGDYIVTNEPIESIVQKINNL